MKMNLCKFNKYKIQNKVIHIGPLPPPLGGISVYLYRLSKIKKNFNDIFIAENKISKIIILKIILFSKNCLFVYHSPSLKRRIMLWLLLAFSTNSYTIVSHGKGLENSYNNSNCFIKFLIKKTILNSNNIQIVGSHLKKFLINLGYQKYKIIIKNAFLPPPLEEENNIIKTYPTDLLNFIKNHTPIIIANAFQIVFLKGIDLYGLDMCVELTAELKNNFPKIGFIFAIANDKVNVTYLEKIKNKIKKYGIEENFYFLAGQKEIWPLFKKTDIMIRPTCSDGFGISVAEALYFGCPAIASDVCERAQGTILFKNRNFLDLQIKVERLLK